MTRNLALMMRSNAPGTRCMFCTERRKGGRADIIKQVPLLEKVR